MRMISHIRPAETPPRAYIRACIRARVRMGRTLVCVRTIRCDD